MSTAGGAIVKTNTRARVRMTFPWGITHDPLRQVLYWTDHYDYNECIGKVSLSSGQIETMALRPQGKNIFLSVLHKQMVHSTANHSA